MLETTWGKRNPYSFSVGVQTGVATVEISMGASQQTQTRTNVLHGCTTPRYIAETVSYYRDLHVHPCLLMMFPQSRDTHPAQVSINRRVNNGSVVHTNHDVLFSPKEKGKSESCVKTKKTGAYHNSDSEG